MRPLLALIWAAAAALHAQTLVLPDATHPCGSASYGASTSITANNCVITGPGTVVFQAGSQIRLENGFRATGGVSFHARIGMQPVNGTLSPNAPTQTSQLFTATYTGLTGYADIAEAHFLAQTGVNGVAACWIKWQKTGNGFYLMNDAGTAWTGPAAPNTATPLRNSQCQFVAAQSSATGTGNTLTVRFSVTASFAGTKNLYLQSIGAAGTSGWQQMGTWQIPTLTQGPPITDWSYVTGNYIGVLGRDTDPGGWIAWTTGLGQGTVDRLGVTGAFLGSTEYATNFPAATAAAQFVTLLYENALNREPAPSEVSSRVNDLNAGRTRPQLAQDFVLSEEFGLANGARAASYHAGWVDVPVLGEVPYDPGAVKALTVAFRNPFGGTEVASGQIEVSAAEGVEGGGCVVNWYSNGWLILAIPGGTVEGQAGEAGTLAGDACSIDTAGSSVQASPDALTVSLAVTFPPSFVGRHTLYTQATNIQGLPNTLANVGTVSVATVTQTVTSVPAGLSLTVDGAACTTPCAFSWVSGSTHTVAAANQAGPTDTQYVFANWSDGGLASHTVTVPASAISYIANFTTQYLLRTAAGTGGSIAPATGWYNSGAAVSVSATANTGQQFTGFSGALTGTTTPQSAPMSGPVTVTANFTPVDFTITLSSSSPTVLPGDTPARPASYTIAVAPVNAFITQNITFAVTGQPSGSTAAFASAPGSTTLTIQVPFDADPHDYPLLLSASVSGVTRTITGVLKVQDYAITALPPSQSTGCQGAVSYQVQTRSVNGFAGYVAMSVPSNLPFYSATLSSGANTSVWVDSATSPTATLTVNTLQQPSCFPSSDTVIPVSGKVYSISPFTRIGRVLLGVNTGSSTVSSVSISPSPAVPSGSTATVTVTLTAPAPAGGVPVGVTSSDTAAFPNGYLTIPQGGVSGSIQLAAGRVNSDRTVTLTAQSTSGSSSQITFHVAPPAVYPLTTSVSPANTGAINPSAGSFGGSVTVTATPSPGYQFTGFNANGTQYSTNPAIIPLTGPAAVTVTFAPADITPLVLSDGAPQATVHNDNTPVPLVYQFHAGGAGTWLDRCGAADPAVTVQILSTSSSSATLGFTASTSAKKGSVDVSCHYTCPGNCEGGIGLPPVRVRPIALLRDIHDDGGAGGGGISCPDFPQTFSIPNNGQQATLTYYNTADPSRNHDCVFTFDADGNQPDGAIRVQPAITYPSNRDTSCSAAFDVTMTAAGATPGPRAALSCQYYGFPGKVPFIGGPALTVTDGTPHITSVSPAYGTLGNSVTVTISGSQLDTVTAVKISGNGCPGPSCGVSAALDDSTFPSTVWAAVTIAPNAKSGIYQLSVLSYAAESERLAFTVADTSPFITYLTQANVQAGQSGTLAVYGRDFGPACDGSGNVMPSAGSPCNGARISVCKSDAPSCTSSDVTPNVTSWSDTRIDVSVNAGTAANGSYDVQVKSAGIAGLGFAPAPDGRTSGDSNREAFTVNGNASLKLELRSGGEIVPAVNGQNQDTTASCAWIDPAPAMPTLAVKIVNTDGSSTPIPGTASYRLDVFWTWKNRDAATGAGPWTETEDPSIPATGEATLDAGATWTVPWESTCGTSGHDQCFMGGWAKVRWRYQPDAQHPAEAQEPAYFYICGKNPVVGNARDELKRVMPDPDYWFIERVAWHESGMSQFCELPLRAATGYCASSNPTEGWPILGPPAGYGIVQRDPLPKGTAEQIMWNWKEAVAEGKRETDALAGTPVKGGDGAAFHFWLRQVDQFNTVNQTRQGLGLPQIPVPPPQTETDPIGGGSCVFKMPFTNNNGLIQGSLSRSTGEANTYWFGDAVLIKQYNGTVWHFPNTGSLPDQQGNYPQKTRNQNYISWNGATDGLSGYWSIFRPNDVSLNTVAEVCSCSTGGSVRLCAPNYKPPSQTDPINRAPGKWEVKYPQ